MSYYSRNLIVAGFFPVDVDHSTLVSTWTHLFFTFLSIHCHLPMNQKRRAVIFGSTNSTSLSWV